MEDLENKVDGITMPAEDSQVSVENSNESSNEPETISFADLGLDEITLAAIEKKGFKVPSPIQVLAIPRLLNGDANVIAKARTGTGKTAAFGLPLVQDLREESDHVRAIILEPHASLPCRLRLKWLRLQLENIRALLLFTAELRWASR